MGVIKEFYNIKANKTVENLQKNNMPAYFLERLDMLAPLLDKLIDDNKTVGFGGSLTLNQTKTLEYLRKRNINLIDYEKEGLDKKDIEKLKRDSLLADVFLCSANAITQNGEIYNVDGNGNRVAATIYGPSKVIIIAGVNKLVNSIEEAVLRVKNHAAPLNVMRLSHKTPCKVLGECQNCKSPERICCSYVTLSYQQVKNRIHVIIINENLGF